MQEGFSVQRIPEVWPGWQADELIGQGAYGKVYRASRDVGGHVLQAAIKVIDIPQDEAEVTALKQMGMDALSIRTHFEDSAQLVMREIATMDVLKGAPNVVGIEDSQLIEHEGGVGWTILIRMELLEALPAHIERVGMPNQREAALIGVAMCNALQACHNAGIVHRDVKPTNVFWSRLGGYKLGDFGLARMMEAGSGSTKSRAGTDDYMAPEVITGHYDYRVDIYSLGCMVYRWLNGGKPPFVSASEIPNRTKLDEAQLRRLSGERPPLPAGAGVDPSLASIVRKAVEPRTEDRWQNASEFGGALQAWLDGAEVVVEGPSDYEGPKNPVKMREVTAEAIPDQLWAGEPVCPELVLTYAGAPLRLGVDYTVSYSGNMGPGEATALVRGMGSFTGQKTLHFTILLGDDSGPVRIREVDVDEIPNQVWAGEPVCPDLSLSYKGEPLTAGFDYTVTYSNNDRPGKATAVVKGQWRFTGQRTLHFSILGVKKPSDGDELTKKLEKAANDYLVNHMPGKLLMFNSMGRILDAREKQISWHLGWKSVIKNARRTFVAKSAEEMLLLLDTSFLGNGKEGLACCTTGIYYRTHGNAGYLSWGEFRSIPTEHITSSLWTFSIGDIEFTRVDLSIGRLMVKLLRGLRDELAKIDEGKSGKRRRLSDGLIEIESIENGQVIRTYGYFEPDSK